MKPNINQILHDGLSGLRNLGTGGTLIVGTIATLIAAYLGDACFVILTRGPHAYFIAHLRVADWKHGILTDGEKLTLASNLLRMFLTMCVWAASMIAAEFIAWFVFSRKSAKQRHVRDK